MPCRATRNAAPAGGLGKWHAKARASRGSLRCVAWAIRPPPPTPSPTPPRSAA
jgi:hypothetical protein